MKGSAKRLAGLLVSTALGSTLVAHGALAQEAAASAANAGANAQLLSDVVVTATRQANTVNRVPLSISAVTQRSLDEQGIKSVTDLQRTVPALTVSDTRAGIATFAIRGIVGGSQGTSSTTGVYLDDIPLQKRNTQGTAQNNGTPTPPLFDLERVEVLRGPQGTLFGGSSMGGTIRFITPQPSLTTYSAQGRAELSSTRYGSESYEGGVAVGGPIVKDKLGFRVTVFGRHNGGYIDLVDPYTLDVRYKDANSGNNNAYRIALAFQPTEALRATLSLYQSYQHVAHVGNSYVEPLNRTLTVPSYCYRVPAPTATFTASAASIPPIACPATAVPGQTVGGVYMRPSQTYGPFNFKPFQNFGPNRTKDAVTTTFGAPSLSLEYEFPKLSVKSITSYIEDQTTSINYEATQVTNLSGYADRNGNFFAPGATVPFQGTTAFVTSSAALFRPFPEYAGPFQSKNTRWGVIQEVRLSSPGDQKPFSWVAGVYYSNIRGNTFYQLSEDVDLINRLLIGTSSSAQRYTQRVPLTPGQTCANLNLPAGTPSSTIAGACLVGVAPLPGLVVAERDQRLKDVEIAGFGEANYWVTEKIRVTAGIRFSRVSLDYQQIFRGPFSGFNVPTVENTGITRGSNSESPITPKVGVQYQINEDDMLYANAAKGFRAGGVNVPLPEAICGQGLSLIGLTVRDAPTTFGSDSVWSYEAGGKFRLFDNRMQLNASAFRIDWSDVQLNVSIPGCAPTFTQNAGTARSEGFDLQAQARFFGFTGSAAVGYNNARYTSTATGPRPANGSPPTAVVQEGDKLPAPPWTVSLGLQYDFQVLGTNRAYVRGDYQFTSAYYNGLGPGVNAYAPDTRRLPKTEQVNLRAGVTFDRFDLNLFVNNVFDSRDPLGLAGGRSGCTPNTDAACGTFTTYNPFNSITTFRPRTIGAQLNYRY